MKTRAIVFFILSIAAFLIIICWNKASANFIISETQSNILYVKSNGTSTVCTSWDEPCDLPEALDRAQYGDQIWVASGTYEPLTKALDPREATFQLKSGVAIYGGFGGTETSLSERDWETNATILSGDLDGDDGADSVNNGQNSFHVVTGIEVDATAILDGFTITSGNALGEYPANFGGGIYNNLSSPSLSNIILTNNSAEGSGGGMYNFESSPSLINVRFIANNAINLGGGIYNANTSSPTLSNVLFQGNSASYGGGGMANVNYSSPALSHVTFAGNHARFGGGLYNYSSSNPVLSGVTISDNSATELGGGMVNSESSNPTLTNVTFSTNSAENDGGGMYNQYSNPILMNVTLNGNSAANNGGGMYDYQSNPTLTNCIIWGSNPDQIYNDEHSLPIITYSDIQGNEVYPGTGNINHDPLLSPLADNGGFTLTHALDVDSPAIDAGDPNNCPTTDQRGFPRPIDADENNIALCDMGAFELGYTLSVNIDGSGSVSLEPEQVDYLLNDTVSLTATPDPGWSFTGWTGDVTSTENPLILTIKDNTNITATFTQIEYSLTVSVNPVDSGTVTVAPNQDTYHYGDEVTLTAIPTIGWSFDSWSGAKVTENVVTITDDTTITANFMQNEYTLTVTTSPPEGGTVSINPDKTLFYYGEEVSLKAAVETGWIFMAWDGDATWRANPLTVTIKGDTYITASFIQAEQEIYLPLILR